MVSLLVFAISTRAVYEIPDRSVRAYAACVETLLDLESALGNDEPEGASAGMSSAVRVCGRRKRGAVYPGIPAFVAGHAARRLPALSAATD